ncbi:hint module-domain-containing protein [Powellomyces hirtus]|nr:hint module-domain-containing protein [Powellomyces hirtus]
MNGCFPGSATVQVHSSGGLDAKKVAFDELKAGMRMLVADRDGSTHYSDVAYVVNLSGDLLYKKIEYVAEDGKTGSVTLTLSHLIQKTASSGSSDATLVKAAEVKAGDYIYHNRAHRVIVTSTSTGMLKPGSGAYSAIPDRADALLIVDGILVSPYSKDHTLADMTFGTATRVLYRSLRFHNKQHWMDAAFCRQLAEALRPLFGNLVSVEAPKVEHLSMTVVAAVAGTLFYKKVRA